jgi:hypothetical protein
MTKTPEEEFLPIYTTFIKKHHEDDTKLCESHGYSANYAFCLWLEEDKKNYPIFVRSKKEEFRMKVFKAIMWILPEWLCYKIVRTFIPCEDDL